MRNVFLALIMPWTSLAAHAGPDLFVASRENVFRQACDQWMCEQLVANHPETFKATEPENSTDFQLPVAHVHQGMGVSIPLEKNNIEQFLNLFFPDGNATRFLILKSLCDFYFPLFERKISNHRLPDALKYLPLVLSGMNPHHTDDRDRAGMWSLDFLTARKLHLRVDSLVDERRGGDITTEKVLDHIQELYLRYDGDQLKVLIAYLKSVPYLKKHLAQYKEVNFDALDTETQQFIKLFIYSVELFELNETENQLVNYFDIMGRYENIFFERNVHVLALKEVLGADLQLILKTNPVYCGSSIDSSYRRVAFILDKNYSVKYHAMKDSLYAWKPSPPVSTVSAEPVEERLYYKVKKGDSLGKIAQKHKVSISQIKKWNNLKRDRIYAGQKLLIIKMPKPESAQQPSAKVNEQPPIAKQELKHEPEEKTTATVKNSISYKVRSGDSLWKIANKYPGVTAEDIMEWNKCTDKITPGQVLVIYPKK